VNPDISGVIVIGTSTRQRSEPQIDAVTVTDVTFPITRTLKSLGVTIDNTLSFDDHGNNVRNTPHFYIRALRHICRCVSVNDAETVVTAVMSSQLDYCNSILSGISSCNHNKLQRVQNALAHTVMGTKRCAHYTSVR